MSTTQRDVLRRLWHFSMHDNMPIWIGGQLQHLVQEALEAEGAEEVNEALGIDIVALSSVEVEEIRERNAQIRNGTAWI